MMKYISLFLIITYFSCNYSSNDINEFNLICYDTLNIDYFLVFTDSVIVENKNVFYRNPYIKGKNKNLKITVEKSFFFDKNSLSLSNNKQFFAIIGYNIDTLKNTIKDTLCFLVNIEESRVISTQQGVFEGYWLGNLWYYQENKIYFDSQYYQNNLKNTKVDKPILLSNINFIKVETFQVDKDKFIIGYADSTTFQFKDSKEILDLYYKPYLIKDNVCYKIKEYYEYHAGAILSISPNKRFLLMEALDIGYIEKEIGEPPFLHDKYWCVIVDMETNQVIEQMSSACGGHWDKNSNWIDIASSFVNPEKLK